MRNYTLTFSFLLPFCINSSTLKAQYVFNEVDIKAGPSSSNSGENGLCLNNKYFFGADDSVHGGEYWISDGTVAGTKMIKDINPGTASCSGGLNLLALNGKVYFAATDGVNGVELWVTDGTAAGTNMVADINIGAGSSNPTTGCVCNGKLYFAANNGSTGKELWVSDGTAAGTQMVKDINPGSADGLGAVAGIAFNGKLYFQGFTTTEGGELWVSDGTASGTTMLKDIIPGSSGGYEGLPVILGGKLYFVSQSKLWVTDGTATGTQMVSGQPTATHIDKEMIAYNGKIYYVTRNDITPIDIELWATDGTTAPQMLKDINPATGSSIPEDLLVYSNKLYFLADDGVKGKELWSSDGTTAGTQMVKDILTGTGGISTGELKSFAGKFIFKTAQMHLGSDPDQRYLFISDGTNAGTFPLHPPTQTFYGTNWGSIMAPGVCNNTAYISAKFNDDGQELWMLTDTTYIPVSINHNGAPKHSFALAPNPSNGNVTVLFHDNYTNAELSVTDMTGREVYTQAINSTSATLNLSALAKGTYSVRLKNESGTETQKLILE